MQILFLSTWFPFPPDNGSKIRVYHLLRALGQQHDVTLVSFAWEEDRADAGRDLPFCRAVHVCRRDPFARSPLALATRYVAITPVVARPIPEMQRLVGHTLTKTPFDVVIASTEGMATYALQAPQETVKILEEHNAYARMMEDRYRAASPSAARLNHWVSWRKARIYEARLFPKFAQVVMVSEQDLAMSTQLAGGRVPVAVVPNGVDCAHHRPGLAETMPNSLIYNGALTYGANYEAMQYFLADIYPTIRKAIPGVTLAITGSTRGVDLDGLKVVDSVRFTGYVDDIRLPVAQSAVCVVPLRTGGGTRLKILEAMALGTPVVATPKGAEGLGARDGEHLLLADTPRAFAECVTRLLHDPAERTRLARNARQFVEALYDWGHIGKSFVKLVETSVDGDGKPARRNTRRAG
jgi:polysaccharide biosynthesis protein PslH